ncbi:hypothetical protein BDW22DRAFT_292332 [Trametopsis cervina]|nr:hypothetical protein BDW22DRAFT_292332 [Trametopsis cervina]
MFLGIAHLTRSHRERGLFEHLVSPHVLSLVRTHRFRPQISERLTLGARCRSEAPLQLTVDTHGASGTSSLIRLGLAHHMPPVYLTEDIRDVRTLPSGDLRLQHAFLLYCGVRWKHEHSQCAAKHRSSHDRAASPVSIWLAAESRYTAASHLLYVMLPFRSEYS